LGNHKGLREGETFGFAMLSHYWNNVFPHLWKHILEHLLTCGGKYKIEQLELMPRWINNDEKDVMARYIIFKTGAELISYCKRTMPHTLQLGGIFPLIDEEVCQNDPKEGRVFDRQYIKAGICSAEGPLKIDLDIKDYDRAGVCECVDANMCIECWDAFMHSSRILIDYILRNIFHFSNVYHFWSGNRGLHIWCFDERVIRWTKTERSTFIDTVRNQANLDHMIPLHLKGLPWPAFDVAVTKDPTHALGVPFGPHHKTGAIRIMLPLLADKEHMFDPQSNLKVSTVGVFNMIDAQVHIDYIKRTWK
jgi:DNA primase catalytic subunit